MSSGVSPKLKIGTNAYLHEVASSSSIYGLVIYTRFELALETPPVMLSLSIQMGYGSWGVALVLGNETQSSYWSVVLN